MEKPETLRQRGLVDQVHAVRERPLLFVTLTACLFAIMAFGATAFTGTTKSAGPITARLRAEPIDINRSAETPAGLVEPRPFDPAEFQAFLLDSDELRVEEDWAAAAIAIERDSDGTIVMNLSGIADPESIIDAVNERIKAFVETLNLERQKQRELASAWMTRFASIWHSQVERAKAAISLSPFNASDTSLEDPLKIERLLRLFIDATVEARTNLQVAGTNTEVIDDAERTTDNLSSDVARLTSAMTDLEIRHAAQFKQVNELRRAEKGLTRHLQESDVIKASDSLLNRPAAIVVSPAALEGQDASLEKTAAIWVAMLSMSLLMAFLGTILMGRLQPSRATAGVISEMFDNPNWPLPPGANRDLN